MTTSPSAGSGISVPTARSSRIADVSRHGDGTILEWECGRAPAWKLRRMSDQDSQPAARAGSRCRAVDRGTSGTVGGSRGELPSLRLPDHGCSELARLSPSPGAVSVPIVPVTVHTVVLRNSSHHSPRSVSAVLLRACAHRDRPNGFPESTSPVTIRAHAQDPGVPRARRPAPSPNRLGYPCTFQDRHDRLRLRVTRLFPQCHQAGPEHCAQRGGHWRPGLRTFRWATARPDPAAGHWNPQRGLGG
jgi:hypothetical protein